MTSISLVASLLSLAALTSAQGVHFPAFGRFPCGTVAGGGPDSSRCSAATLNNAVIPGGQSQYFPISGTTTQPGPQKSLGYPPLDSECVLAEGTGSYYCGWVGATCTPGTENTALTKCDNGVCVANPNDPTTGTCQGDIGYACNGEDANCIGNIYCTRGNTLPGQTPIATCGQAINYPAAGTSLALAGARCTEPTYVAPDNAAQQQANVDTLCPADAFCSPDYGCAFYIATGENCPIGQPFGCDAGNTCVDGVCRLDPVPSGARARSRARRNNLLHKRGLCPASHSACSLPGSRRGFECIDTQSNLEQCGACASAGGVDCTALPGVDSVGCVGGQCEIWACADGFAYDPASSTCQASLVF